MGWYGEGSKSILAVTFEKEILLKMVLILPCTRGEWCYKKNRMRVSVGKDANRKIRTTFFIDYCGVRILVPNF